MQTLPVRFHISQFHAAVEVHQDLDLTGDRMREFLFPDKGDIAAFPVCRQGRHGSQIASRGLSHDGDVVRLIAVFIRVGPKEADRRLHVRHRIRIDSLLSQAVVYAGHRIAVVAEIPVDQPGLPCLGVARYKAASVDHDHQVPCFSVRYVQIQIVGGGNVRIGDLFVDGAAVPALLCRKSRPGGCQVVKNGRCRLTPDDGAKYQDEDCRRKDPYQDCQGFFHLGYLSFLKIRQGKAGASYLPIRTMSEPVK